jgi:hypothetical protein
LNDANLIAWKCSSARVVALAPEGGDEEQDQADERPALHERPLAVALEPHPR